MSQQPHVVKLEDSGPSDRAHGSLSPSVDALFSSIPAKRSREYQLIVFQREQESDKSAKQAVLDIPPYTIDDPQTWPRMREFPPHNVTKLKKEPWELLASIPRGVILEDDIARHADEAMRHIQEAHPNIPVHRHVPIIWAWNFDQEGCLKTTATFDKQTEPRVERIGNVEAYYRKGLLSISRESEVIQSFLRDERRQRQAIETFEYERDIYERKVIELLSEMESERNKSRGNIEEKEKEIGIYAVGVSGIIG
ncbi:hypothetical protein BU23DRAFT_644024 [Bimuria novae-zelandiae CBS 107.79]|uniref:Uncharacterized protein n=1 Tax=Bimuria novae-zelandiae CBS 107.79 TaxID=1447943 RepID=A0A6A5V6N2_9PLEO|nr:hypothetical protein BU23DRAFT_644024 [Bimuria novae-zelandiae CBS 107.79]